MDCIFCKIANHEIPSKVIYEDDIVMAFLDVNPNKPGHTLIVPKKHIKDMDNMDDDTYLYIFKIAKELKNKLIDKLNCDGMQICQNNGDCQEVKHYHMHLIPYYNDKVELDLESVYNKIMN